MEIIKAKAEALRAKHSAKWDQLFAGLAEIKEGLAETERELREAVEQEMGE